MYELLSLWLWISHDDGHWRMEYGPAPDDRSAHAERAGASGSWWHYRFA